MINRSVPYINKKNISPPFPFLLFPFPFPLFPFFLFPSFSFCSSLPHFSFFFPGTIFFPPPLAIVFCIIYTPGWPPTPLGIENVQFQENSEKKSGEVRGSLRYPILPFLGPPKNFDLSIFSIFYGCSLISPLFSSIFTFSMPRGGRGGHHILY